MILVLIALPAAGGVEIWLSHPLPGKPTLYGETKCQEHSDAILYILLG